MSRLSDLVGPQRRGPRTDELARVAGPSGLGQVPLRLAPDATTTSVCGFCSTGCSLDVHLRHGQAVNLTPTRRAHVNGGHACPKGWEALAPLDANDRLLLPHLRVGSKLEPTDWETAIARVVDGFRSVQRRHGPESVAFLSTGQIPTEEMALLGTLAKFGMGMVHGDGNTRQCMATSVAAHKACFGFDAPPYTYADLERSDVVVLWGSNLAIAHPILWQRLWQNPHSPTVVAVDPRRTDTAAAADVHVAVTPSGDLDLAYGLAHLLIAWDAIDHGYVRAHVDDFDGFARHVAGHDPDTVSARTGVPRAQIEQVARLIAQGQRVSIWWTMGVNQSHQGTLTAQALIALALITGNMGRPGTGANSVTGQCNAMGSRLFSNTTSLLGGRDFADETHRQEVATVLGIEPARIPDTGSWAYDRIMEGILRGEIRALWVIATNPAHSWINQTDCHDLLDRLDLLVVQDMYATTETVARADVALPAAGWGEKDGTFINSERRIQVTRKVRRAPGQALADFWIFKAIADAWGCGDVVSAFTDPVTTFDVLRRLSAGRPCDFSGIAGIDHLDAEGGIQWPLTADEAPGPIEPHRRLFGDGRFFTPNGRARLVWGDATPPAEQTNATHPLRLLTGRGSSAQWHTQTRTSKSVTLRSLAPSTPVVEIHPDDATARGVAHADWVSVRSARGSMRARADVTATVGQGQVFVAMHDPATNRLTHPSFDPTSRQPAYKDGAVEVGPVEAWEQP